MKRTLFVLVILSMFLNACGQGFSSKQSENSGELKPTEHSEEKISLTGETIQTRFKVPEGYQRIASDTTSFSLYLSNLPLKPQDSKVLYYNGDEKIAPDVYEAVVDLPIGNKNLHQCADAVIRLRAEYLYNQERFADIHFNFTNGFRADYSKWAEGKRIVVNGNNVFWRPASEPSNTKKGFWNYLETVFTYAGTASLSQELKSVPLEDLAIGDVFIQGGFPGHAVIVVDMARHKITGQTVFLLAQSYMPAQDIQILKNPNEENLSPWYNADFGEVLKTPEWVFRATDLKRFVGR